MPKIKFSHEYAKMPDLFTPSRLLDVIKVDLADLSPEFLEYDTRIFQGDRYPLPKRGEYLILFLHSAGNELWTTIRRATASKEKYYRSMIGQHFDILVKGVNWEGD